LSEKPTIQRKKFAQPIISVVAGAISDVGILNVP
jgi:hypothetical protein